MVSLFGIMTEMKTVPSCDHVTTLMSEYGTTHTYLHQ